MSRYWFEPAPGYDGPPIELTAGWHDRNGKFHPKHVKRSPGISRLSGRPRRRLQMVRDNGLHLIGDLYLAVMAEKHAGKVQP